MKNLFPSLLALCLLSSSLHAQVDPHYVLNVSDGLGPSGLGIDVRVTADIVPDAAGSPPDSLQGWSFGVCHDPLLTSVSAVVDGVTTLTVSGGSLPDFNQITLLPTGFTVAVVIDFFGSFPLPAGTDYELNVATYQLSGPLGTTTPLAFCDTLGSPPVETIVVATATPQNSIIPVQNGGSLTIALTDAFQRGDCDNSGSFNLPDMVYLLGYLFPQSGNPNPISPPPPPSLPFSSSLSKDA
ncbi:MAG: hypothetical protein AAF581_13925, partial [Planctomycetota bacterium]